jgi:hypothetical protein
MSALTCGCDAAVDHFCVDHSFWSPHSSNVQGATFNPQTKELRITFHRGRTYAYQNFDPVLWEAFVAAESKGTFFQQVIKEDWKGVPVNA